MTAPQPALIPPDPSVSGRFWLKSRFGDDVAAIWTPERNWAFERWEGRWMPEDAAAMGYTFTSPTPRPIPTSEQMDAVYVLTAEPKLPERPAGEFALGYHVGMEYAARKLAQALEAKP